MTLNPTVALVNYIVGIVVGIVMMIATSGVLATLQALVILAWFWAMCEVYLKLTPPNEASPSLGP